MPACIRALTNRRQDVWVEVELLVKAGEKSHKPKEVIPEAQPACPPVVGPAGVPPGSGP